jgi:hypothetical protein
MGVLRQGATAKNQPLEPPTSTRSTLTAPPAIEKLRIRIAALFAQKGERHAKVVIDNFSSSLTESVPHPTPH